MAFVNDAGRCAHLGAARTAADMREEGVFASLAAYTKLETFKKHPEIERFRSATLNVEAFLKTNRRDSTLLTVSQIIVMLSLT